MAQTRITAGEWRGRVIDTPRGMRTRPTRSLIRQSLFDILGAAVAGAAVLDVYAGAGTVGFEALSRGAQEVVFVEHGRQAVTAIRGTAARLGCADRCRVVHSDVLRWLRRSSDVLAGAHRIGTRSWTGCCPWWAPRRPRWWCANITTSGTFPSASETCSWCARRAAA